MGTFAYQVRSSNGRFEAGAIVADSLDEALRMLRADGKTIVSLQPGRSGASALRGPKKKVKHEDVIFFATQLAVMVDTGVTLPEALDAIAEQTEHTGLRAMVSELSSDVKSGVEFSASLEKHPKVFGRLFVALMRASEISGTMGQMLQRVSEYMEQERETRKRIKGAMTYPVCMLSFSVLVVMGLLIFVLPRFEKIYEGKGAMLPLPTRVLLTLSSVIIGYWPFILGGLVMLVVGGYMYFRSPSGCILLDKVRISMPVIGGVYRKAYLARSLRAMATMVSTGVSVLDGLAITAQVAGNRFYGAVWESMARGVEQGAPLSEGLFQSDLIPPAIAQMVSAGERTGRLGMVMNRVAGFCEDDLKVSVRTLTSLIEPAMIIVMGLMIGGIAMALLLPVFRISKVLSQ